MQREGYSPHTIYSHSRILRLLAKHCSLDDSETVRAYVATRHVSGGRKANLVEAYGGYARYHRIAFSKPFYVREETLPFIPLQKEIELLIDATRNIRHAAMLRLLYESGMRIGEASRLKFKDFDFERRTVRVVPEKGSRSRELRLSEKLCSMLKNAFVAYPKRPFLNPEASRKYTENTRRYLAEEQNNSRFLNIHLHTLRHFRATQLYWQTKDLLYVQKILGHRSITNTLRYTQLVDWKDDSQFVCKAAETVEEARVLVEKGFEYVTDVGEVKPSRKRK